MKYRHTLMYLVAVAVAPFAGAWIEITYIVRCGCCSSVAPFAGAWIEIEIVLLLLSTEFWSLPSRERGLK